MKLHSKPEVQILKFIFSSMSHETGKVLVKDKLEYKKGCQ